MDVSTALVSVKGQLTIPKKVRIKLGIKTGDRILFKEKSGEIVIRKMPLVDAQWARGIQETLSEWEDDLDDDL